MLCIIRPSAPTRSAPLDLVPMRRVPTALVLSLALAPAAGSAVDTCTAGHTETCVVAWGDSITYGYYDGTTNGNDCSNGFPEYNAPEQCGYPGRLGERLNDSGLFSPIYDVEVLNLGLGGEKTPGALSRMDRNIWDCPCTEVPEGEQPCAIQNLKYWVCNGTVGAEDLLVLMEGTNDVTQNFGVETIRFNLEQLGLKAEALGLNVVISTLTPRHPDGWTKDGGCADNGSSKLDSVNDKIETELSPDHDWPLVDPFTRLSALSGLFTTYYQHWDPMRCDGLDDQGSGDPVGHPNGPGFDKMTFDGGAYYSLTFESVVRGALPPRLTVTPPAPPLDYGESLAFSATLPDLAQTAELTWDFGDGTVVSTNPGASPANQNHTYSEGGIYNVVVTAEHANGGARQESVVLEVSLLLADGFESGDTSAWTEGSD